MISPWDVYWVLQLDAIRVLIVLLGVASVAFGAFCLTQWIGHRDYTAREPYYGYGVDTALLQREVDRRAADETARKAKAPAWLLRGQRVIALGVAMIAVFFLMPSTQTAAAMLLIPKLTSPEVLQPVGAEAKELLALTKGMLRKLGANDEQPEPKK